MASVTSPIGFIDAMLLPGFSDCMGSSGVVTCSKIPPQTLTSFNFKALAAEGVMPTMGDGQPIGLAYEGLLFRIICTTKLLLLVVFTQAPGWMES